MLCMSNIICASTAFFPQDQLFIRSKNPLWVFECMHAFTPQTDELYNVACAKWQTYMTEEFKSLGQAVQADLAYDMEHVLGLLYNQNVVQLYMDHTEKQITQYLPWEEYKISNAVSSFIMSKFAYQPLLPELYLRYSPTTEQTLSKAFGCHKDYSMLVLSSNVSDDNIRTIHENFNHETCTYIAVDNPNIHLARIISMAGFMHFDFTQAYSDLLHQTDFTNFIFNVVANGEKKLSAETLEQFKKFIVVRKFIESTLNALNPLEAGMFFIDEEPFITYKTTLLEFMQDIKTCYHEDVLRIIYGTLLERKKDILRPEQTTDEAQ